MFASLAIDRLPSQLCDRALDLACTPINLVSFPIVPVVIIPDIPLSDGSFLFLFKRWLAALFSVMPLSVSGCAPSGLHS